MKYSLYPGRFQPFHDGHAALVKRLIGEGKNVCIALRDTDRDDDNPYSLNERIAMIMDRFGLEVKSGKVLVGIIPDIEEIVYGRGVGYAIRQIEMPKETELISGTEIRGKGIENA